MLQIAKAIEAAGCAIRDMSMKAPTLENVFLQLTGRELRE
jgi:hypothetical protein